MNATLKTYALIFALLLIRSTGAIAGPAEKVRAKVQELFTLGIDEISCAYLNGNFEQMDTVGREIISAVATTAA